MASNYGKAKKEPYSKETVLEQIYDDDHHQHHHHQNNQMLSFGMMQSSPSSSSTVPSLSLINMNKDVAYDQLGELDQALFLYLDGQDQPAHQVHRHNPPPPAAAAMIRPQHTLDIFPSEPMHVDPISTKENTGFVSQASGSKKSSESSMGLLSNPTSNHVNNPAPAKAVKREGNRKGPTSSSDKQGLKTHDPKTLRRLAQNREAAKKSRLRKKAYVQQLETSRLRLTQLEQEIQRARSQGFYNLGVAGDQSLHAPPMPNISPDAALFDMEYARWLEEHRRLMEELRQAVHDHLPDNDLRMYVDSWLAQHEQVMGLTSMIAKSDAFHLLSGIWKTPAERCFMWMGGYRPSDLVKIILREIEALTEEQVVGICRVQQSAQEAEEALSQGLHSLYQSLTQTLISDSLTSFNSSNMNTYMSEMAVAINQLSTIEGFIQQADNLRHQTLQRLHQILTTRQAARCFLAIGEYFHRLRALSSLWLARPRQE